MGPTLLTLQYDLNQIQDITAAIRIRYRFAFSLTSR